MNHPVRTARLIVLFTLALLLLRAPRAADAAPVNTAERGTIEGRVLNAATGAYLENVRISIAGTNVETITDPEGTYRLPGVPAGEVQLTASYIGLIETTRPVSVQPGR